MPKIPFPNLIAHIRSVRLKWAFGFALVLFVLLDLAVIRLERMPYLALRTEARSHDFMPYFFKQMERTTDRPVIAVLGASVEQGYMNAFEDRTWPVILEGLLNARGMPARCFNLAALGNNLGDGLGLATEALRCGADVILVPLYFKNFSNQGTLGMMTCNYETAWYLRRRPDISRLRRTLLRVPNREWDVIRLDKDLERFWAFYREAPLISYLLTGGIDPIPMQFGSAILDRVGREKNSVGQLMNAKYNPAERNGLDMWIDQPAVYFDHNRETFAKMVLNADGEHFQVLELLSELGQDSRAQLIFYITPICRAMNDEHRLFPWTKHAQFVRMMRDVVEDDGHLLIDMTDAVDNRLFTDLDHFTMNGHDQFARAVLPYVKDALDADSASRQAEIDATVGETLP